MPRKASGSSWTFISEEELYGGYRGRKTAVNHASCPEKIRALLEMTDYYEVDEERRTDAFLKQARFMEEYEDDYRMRSLPVHHIYAAYQELSADELRGYFSWRTRIRRGEKAPGSRDFRRLYTAELINLIGVSSPQEAFDALLRLQASAGEGGEFLPGLSLKGVLRDFVIAYGMEQDLALAYCIEDWDTEAANLALAAADRADDYSLYEAVRTLVGDQIDASRFLPQIRGDACHVIARVLRILTLREREQKGSGIFDRILGPVKKREHTMFSWLPFRSSLPDGYVYEVDPVRSYEYRGGRWTCSSYAQWRNPDEVRALSEIVRECERLLRKSFHYKNALPDRRKDPQTARLITSVIEAWLKEKADRNRPKVHIDLTKLSEIRRSAAITRDRLLEGTGEDGSAPDDMLWDAMAAPVGMAADSSENGQEREAAKPAAPAAETAGAAEKPLTQISETTEGIFTVEESTFLGLLLDGKPWKEFITGRHLMLSVFVDSINEKAYDELGDSVVEIEDGVPVLVEEYAEDVREMI